MATSSTSANTTFFYDEPRPGWVQSGQDRGTLDIIWSCSVTIFLCCWVATHPNVGSPRDGFIQRCIDKSHLAMIGLLGPDFLFGIALGQFCSASRSVKKFRRDKLTADGSEWTYTYAFFTDMGGMLLTSPDFPDGFPINAEQLHWLVKHRHVDLPDMKQMNIGERNASDTLSRILTVWQALWFSIIEIQRVRVGLPMTTLELTALSYVFVMLATQICWFKKPSIGTPRKIHTKDNRLAEEIRAWARKNTHYDLPEKWYRTPVDFIDGPRFQIDTHWRYYTRLTHLLRIPIVSRPMRCKPWDRFPSDTWAPAEKSWVLAPFGGFVLLVFSGWFLFGWNFYFPTPAEQLMWRVCAVLHAAFGIYGALYYMVVGFRWHAAYEKLDKVVATQAMTRPLPPSPDGIHVSDDVVTAAGATNISTTTTTTATKVTSTESTVFVGSENADVESQIRLQEEEEHGHLSRRSLRFGFAHRRWKKLDSWLDRVRNISPDKDPEMALPLRVIVPVTIICAIYTACRIYFYVEDWISFRVQPVGVYLTVNRYVPFWGDG